MASRRREAPRENIFADTFAKSTGRHITLYMKNGKAMAGILRSYNSLTVSIDTPAGVQGGTQVDCGDISSVSVK